LAGDGDLELVSEHTTDFVGGKSQDTATATAVTYAGSEAALVGSSVHGELSSPTSREVSDEETTARDAGLPPALTSASEGEAKEASPAGRCVARGDTVAAGALSGKNQDTATEAAAALESSLVHGALSVKSRGTATEAAAALEIQPRSQVG
jgi:hypothetical protein